MPQHRNRHLDTVPAGAPVVEVEHSEKAEVRVDGHILAWRIVCFPSMIRVGSLTVLSVCVASVIRVPYIAHISLVDPSWSDVGGAVWSVVEPNLGIVSACLPTLRPLFLHVFRGGYSSISNSQPFNKRSVGKAEDGLSDKSPTVQIEAVFKA